MYLLYCLIFPTGVFELQSTCRDEKKTVLKLFNLTVCRLNQKMYEKHFRAKKKITLGAERVPSTVLRLELTRFDIQNIQ